MAEDNYPKDPGYDLNSGQSVDPNAIVKAADFGTFPPIEHQNRINYYKYYEKLFMGDHFAAFSYYIDDEKYTSQWQKLRYVQANFAGLVTKIIADFLFSEPIVAKVPDGDQEWIDAFWRENNMDTQLYESALTNSHLGDDLFKLRVGLRNPYDDFSTVIAEEITPQIYFPKVDGFNVRAVPAIQELAWTFTLDKKKYLRKEIHEQGFIRNEVWEMRDSKVVAQVGLEILSIPGLLPIVPTGVKESLLFHVPNWKTGNRFFGISDYHDLDALFFAINNRLSKVDNILDKHSDPILKVPPGVLDEDGKVRKKALGVIEVQEGEDGKIEYIVWDASLDNAFKQLEQLVDSLFMTSEISPEAFGKGKDGGNAESGRALKYKLLRVLAKAARKKLYYDTKLKDMLFVAQKLSKVHGLKVGGKTLQGEPMPVEIWWNDGIPIDELEQVEIESKKIDAGVQSKKDAIMAIDGIDEEAAEEKIKQIEKEKPAIEVPTMNLGKNNKNMNMPNDDSMSMMKGGAGGNSNFPAK